MTHRAALALDATRRLRDSAAFRGLSGHEQRALAGDLERIERVLGGETRPQRYGDPYALAQATPADFHRDLAGPGAGAGAPARPAGGPPAGGPPATAGAPARRSAIETSGDVGTAIDQIDFPGFVAGLICGTFQAIVDATVQQMREYAQLVASLSRTADEFARDNVSDDQVRASLAGRHRELHHAAPPPGSPPGTRLDIAPDAVGTTPAWLADYDLADEPLTPELVDGPILAAGRRRVAEERMQSLATMVLMGINRIVVNEGDIRAKVQFSAHITEKSNVDSAVAVVSSGIAGRAGQSPPQLMVATVKSNSQADAAVKANLTGEVRISFRTETFPLERFADSAAIQLLNRHARWRGDEPAAAAAPAPSANAPPGNTRGNP